MKFAAAEYGPILHHHHVLRAAALLLLVPFLLAGCLRFETTVAVMPDGSGTITERVLIGSEIVEMFAGMAPEGETFQVMDEAELRDKAANYGDGVRLLTAEPLTTDFGQGFLARYGFEDVSRLRLETDPGSKIPDQMGEDAPAEGGDEAPSEPEVITFAFDPAGAGPAKLLVNWPIEEPEAGMAEDRKDEAEAPAAGPEELEMMKAFLAGMRMTFAIEVVGEITETNATHREGSRVTLLDVAFDDLLSDPEALAAMAQDQSQSLADLKALMERIPGLKFEVEPEVSIRFR